MNETGDLIYIRSLKPFAASATASSPRRAASASGGNLHACAGGQVDFLDYCRDQPSPGEFTHVFFNGCLHNFLEPGEALAGAARLLEEVLVARLIAKHLRIYVAQVVWGWRGWVDAVEGGFYARDRGAAGESAVKGV